MHCNKKTSVSELSEPALSTDGIISMYCVESTAISGICGHNLASSEFEGVVANRRSADPSTDPY